MCPSEADALVGLGEANDESERKGSASQENVCDTSNRNSRKVEFTDDSRTIPEGCLNPEGVGQCSRRGLYFSSDAEYHPGDDDHSGDPRFRLPYLPLSADGSALVFDYSIHPNDLSSYKQQAQRLSPLGDAQDQRQIVSSMSCTDQNGMENIEIHHTKDESRKGNTRWLHMNRQIRSLDDFQNFALEVSKNSRMMSLVLSKLMDQVKTKFSEDSNQGMQKLHGVLRCDAQDPENLESVDTTTTWICFPYFSEENEYTDRGTKKLSGNSYRTQTLFQWCHEKEAASEHDEIEWFGRVEKSKKLLYVPYLWILVLGTDTIVSSAPCPLDRLLRDDFQQKAFYEKPTELEWVRVINPLDHTFTFRFLECDSFLKLNSIIEKRVLKETRFDLHNCALFLENRPLTATLWLLSTKRNCSPTITVFVQETKDRYDDRVPVNYRTEIAKPRNHDLDTQSGLSEVQDDSKKSSGNKEGQQWRLSSVDLAIQAPDDDSKTIIHEALSSVRPFFKQMPNLKPQMIVQDENMQLLHTLSLIHGRLKASEFRLQIVVNTRLSLNSEDMESQLYSEAPTSTLQQLETVLQINHDAHFREVVFRLVQSSKQLISTFVPYSETHILLEKVWGALKTLIQVTTPKHIFTLTWLKACVITSDGQENLWQKYQVPRPDYFIHCLSCKRGEKYDSLDDAVKHIRQQHYYKDASEVPALHSLVKETEEKWLGGRNSAQILLLQVASHHLELLQEQVQNIRLELASSSRSGQPTYTLPDALVETFANIVVFLLAMAREATHIEAEFATWVPSDGKTLNIAQVDECLNFVDGLGDRVEESMHQARDGILKMINQTASKTTYEVAGPRFMTSFLLKSMLAKPSIRSGNITKRYRDLLLSLRHHVLYLRPRRLLLGDIHLLQDEIRAARSVCRVQTTVLSQFRKAIDPETFFVFDDPEDDQARFCLRVLNEALKMTLSDGDELSCILRSLDTLEHKARHRIEIMDEDHGKAIFVFTLVTAIFLPLSFVTSYMGMNTADIREMNVTQERFWAIAVPVTAAVMAMAVYLAYEGHAVSDWLTNLSVSQERGSRQAKKIADTMGKQSSEGNLTSDTITQRSSWWRRGNAIKVARGNKLPV